MEASIKDFIGVYKNAYSKEFCEALIEHFEVLKSAGLTKTRQQTNPKLLKIEQDDEQFFAHEMTNIKGSAEAVKHFSDIFWGDVYPSYASTYDILKRADAHTNYHFKLQKTHVGGGYHVWHSEAMGKDNCDRLLVWTLYLNDVEEGGETEFLYYPLRIKPETGTLVLWPAAFTHTHRGNPPISNDKYIVTGWIEF